jgi:hypothetical protein
MEEGRAGQTKPDFIAKNFIQPFLRQANEFIAMLTASLKTARSSPSRG